MATEPEYIKEEYNLMSKFADLTELESSSDEEGINVVNKLNASTAHSHAAEQQQDEEEKEIIRPTKPRNDNSKFDLTQFCDLSALDSSDEDTADPHTKQPSRAAQPVDDKHASQLHASSTATTATAAATTLPSKPDSSPKPPLPSTAPPPKPKHSKAALKSLDAKQAHKKSFDLKQNITSSVVKGVIGVKSKIDALHSKHKHNDEQYLQAYETLISMGFDEAISFEASQKCKGDMNRCISYIESRKPLQDDAKSAGKMDGDGKEVKRGKAECPWRKVLMFGMHLHLVGSVLPQWMVDVLTLFNDSNLKACHEAASLGKLQRKLFVDTMCSVQEPENFIFVDTQQSIEKISSSSNWAIVNVESEQTKYSQLKSINNAPLNALITGAHNANLEITKGVYLFFNLHYKRDYLDYFLSFGSNAQSPSNSEHENEHKNAHIVYYCDEYKQQQREHIKKMLALDYEIGGKYADWMLAVYDRYLAHFDVNDCYELLAGNLAFWVDVICHRPAMEIQSSVDHTFVVLTADSRQWIDDTLRDECAYSQCHIKFGVVNRKHHCRSCGDIFCKHHCEKQVYKRNDALELQPRWSRDRDRSVMQSPYYEKQKHVNVHHHANQQVSNLDDTDDGNERPLRMCPDCKRHRHMFVDVPHRHKFMDCHCLKWSVHSIDFEHKWKAFISAANENQ